MTPTRNAQLEAQLKQALRVKIGEQRYQTWFVTTGARFEIRDDALVVTVGNVWLDFFRNAFGSCFSQIALDVLGAPTPVVFEKAPVANLPESLPLRPTTQSQPTLLPFPPQSSQRIVSPQQPTFGTIVPSAPIVSEPTPESVPAEPPKRKRGRPRKNPVPVQNAAPSSVATPAASNPESLLDGRYAAFDGNYAARLFNPTPEYRAPATFVPTAPMGPPLQLQSPFAAPSVQDDALATPPKRKRGRPRKNPETAAPAIDMTAAPVSFTDAYVNSLQQTTTETGSAVQSPAFELSDGERAAASVGDFSAPVASLNLGSLDVAPRKRGRPKGSVNKREQSPDLFGRNPNEVSRDANGYNIVQAPKESKPRIKGDGISTREFATLESFIVGPSNDTCMRIVNLVVAEPTLVSPFYIYGPTSVGKTHLLEGLCNKYSKLPRLASKPPLFMTAEQFTTAFIRSLQGGAPFRDRFRNISLFALDDLHFLEGKKSTQTELVYVLEYLKNQGVQVVITGNKPLVDFTDLREELYTRIQGGILVEIAPPERETLAKIFVKFAFDRHIVVTEDVSRYVVSRFATHARELSGVLNRLYVAHLSTGAPITLDLARQALADMVPVAYRNIRLEDVERVVQEAFALEPNALKSSSRAKKNADPRAIAMWLARKHTRAALAEIGAYFGGRRHSAVLSAQKKVEDWLHEDGVVASADRPEIPVAEIVKSLERALSVPSR